MRPLEDLYQDMLAGSIYAAIAWMRHPQVCTTLPKEIIDLIELEINARNDEIAGLRAEVLKSRTDVDGLRTRNKDIYTALLASNDSTADMCTERDKALNEREELRAENEALKKIERERWDSAASAFGDRYSTVSDKFKNMPMNMDDFGTRRPGDF